MFLFRQLYLVWRIHPQVHSDAIIVDVLISAPPKPNISAANKLSKTLSDSRTQNLIFQNSRDGEFLKGKAKEILWTNDKSYEILQVIFGQISAVRQCFIGRISPPSITYGWLCFSSALD